MSYKDTPFKINYMIDAIDTAGLGLIDPVGEPLTGDYAPSNNTSKPRFRVHNNRLVLYISNTLINKFFRKGEEIEYCPKAVYEEYIMSRHRKAPTVAMNNGSYFETKCIGGGAGGNTVDSLPLLRNGKLSAANKRIDEQIVKFKVLKDEYGMILKDDLSNTQVKGMIHYPQDHWVDVEIFLTGEFDWVTPIPNYKGHNLPNTLIDLKLTGDLNSSYGPFAWTPREFINTQQLTIYHLISGLPTAFWVFDYPAKQLSNEIIFVNHDVNHKNPQMASKARWRIQSTKEVIRKTINEIVTNFREEWPAKPSSELCKGCPVLSCTSRNSLSEL